MTPMALFYAIDFTRAGDRSFAIKLLRELLMRLPDESLVSILLYGVRAYPLLDPTPRVAIDIEALADQLSFVPSIDGPSEPYRPLREAVNIMLEQKIINANIVVYWSAARQPRVPLWLQGVYPDNVGACWSIVINKPSPPRWMHRVLGVETGRLHTIRKNTPISRLAQRLLDSCPHTGARQK